MALTITIRRIVRPFPDSDVIRIRADVTRPNGNAEKATAEGSYSAVTNYFPPARYNPDGTLKPGATSRQMNQAEMLAYAENLVRAQYKSDPDDEPMPTVLYDAP